MSDVNVTVVGHVGQDPTLYQSDSGLAWTSVRVASTARIRDREGNWRDGNTIWFTARAFGEKARNVCESIKCGTPVVITGRLQVEEYEVRRTPDDTESGSSSEVPEKRTANVIQSATFAIDISRGVAKYQRIKYSNEIPAGGERLEITSSDPSKYDECALDTTDGDSVAQLATVSF